MSSHVFATNKAQGTRMLVANKVVDIGGDDRSNDRSKYMEPKTGKLAKSLKLF